MAKVVQSGKISVIIHQNSVKILEGNTIWFHQVNVTLYVYARDSLIAAKATRLFKLQTRQSFYSLHRSH